MTDDGGPMQFTSARDLFESAREASRDAERIRRQLAAMEGRATSLGGGGFEPRVRSTPDPDRIGQAVVAMVDVESKLRERQEEDYRLLDLASAVLYGTDSDAGLWSLVGWRADAIYHHYLGGLTWCEVGALLGYSEQHVWREAMAALDVCDGWGIQSIIDGHGAAQS